MSNHQETKDVQNKFQNQIAKALVLVISLYIIIRANFEFYAISWGTGAWLGNFSLKWGVGFFVFVLFCFLLYGCLAYLL